jgi:thioesterase domain-containing protein
VLARDSGDTWATPEAIMALRADAQGMDMEAFIAECKARALIPETVTLARAEQVERRMDLLARSHGDLVPGPLPVSVTMFSSDDAINEKDPFRGWRDMPGGAPFRLVRVPGTHHTMWTKGNVEVTGAVISREIRASSAGGG